MKRIKKMMNLLFILLMFLNVTSCKKNKSEEEVKELETMVYYLNFKPEADAAWQELAKIYSEQTGIGVKVVSPASGQYESTLVSQLGKEDDPVTMFQISSKEELETFGGFTYNLVNTDIYSLMTSHSFDIEYRKRIAAIGYCYEAFGLITNLKLLNEAGYRIEDIYDFESLRNIVRDVHERSEELGFDAFTSSGLDATSSWRFTGHLINMPLFYEFKENDINDTPGSIKGTYLKNYREMWDLYLDNNSKEIGENISSSIEEARREFINEEALFYQNGSWEYNSLINGKMNPNDLYMLPLYIGIDNEEAYGLACGSQNSWAINSRAPKEKIDATLAFIKWVITSKEGTEMMAKEFGSVPFKDAKKSENVFLNQANDYLKEGKLNVDWVFNDAPNIESWRKEIVDALIEYSSDQSDKNWANVEDAIINNWEIFYKEVNQQ